MKTLKGFLLAALVLASPMLTFARGENARLHKINPDEWQKSPNRNRDMGAPSGGRIHVETGPPKGEQSRTRARDISAFRK
jgi:hypothetical protein